MSLPFVEMIPQRSKGDCGIAALAMLLNKSYEDVFVAAISKTCRNPHTAGMYTRQLQAAARRLGTRLFLKRTWDLETSCGLLTVERRGRRCPTLHKHSTEFSQHLVLLKFGLIFDSADTTAFEPEDYFIMQEFRPVSILVEQEDR